MPKSLIIFFIAIALAAGAISYIGKQMFGDLKVPEESRVFSVEQGETVKQISASLIEKGIVKSDFWFRTIIWLKGKESRFLAGNFELLEKTSYFDLIRLLTTEAKKEVKTIKILEGWGIGDIGEYFEKEGIADKEEFFRLVGLPGIFGSSDNVFFNELSAAHPIIASHTATAPMEGYLFPDTYEIYSDAKAKDIVQKMAANFDSKITQDLRDEAARQGKNFYKALIMASIIEAEVPHEEDRPIVSDIFWSRMEAGVALQSDATLHYIIGGSSPSLTTEELKIDSAYNTYKYNDLPPTPIGNPGISAIRAALYPEDTDYFYFLSTPEGNTIFSRTLEEHNAAKKKYLQ